MKADIENLLEICDHLIWEVTILKSPVSEYSKVIQDLDATLKEIRRTRREQTNISDKLGM